MHRAVGLSAPAMVDRLRWQLDAWMTSGDVSAGVVLLRLGPDEVRGDDGDQVRLWGGPSAADERATRAVARLAGLVGDEGVLVPTWRGDAGRVIADGWAPASTTDLTDADDTAERLRPRPLTAATAGWWRRGGPGRARPGSLPTPSPAIVPGDAQRAESLDAAGQPVAVSRRASDGGAGDVGCRRAPAGGGHRLGRAVAARRVVVEPTPTVVLP